MLGFYYSVWVDCISAGKRQPGNWTLKSMIFMSAAMVFNFVLFMVILQQGILNFSFYILRIPSLSKETNNVLTLLVLFILPIVIINYLLIFRGKRYKKLLKRYPSRGGKLFITYFVVSLSFPILLLWTAIIFFR